MNQLDLANARAARERERQIRSNSVPAIDRTPHHAPHAFGPALYLDDEGHEIDGDSHSARLAETLSNFSYYLYDRRRKGKTIQCKVPTDSLSCQVISIRPDFWGALCALSLDAKHLAPTRAFVLKTARLALAAFREATGLRPVAVAIHLNEGCGHIHLSYSPVSQAHRLLWAKQAGKGRRGLRLLGPCHTGTLRLVEAGYLPETDASFATKDLEDRRRGHGGADPIDWHLSRVVDDECTCFFAAPERDVVWTDQSHIYRRGLAERRANRPDVLRAKAEAAEAEAERLRTELSRAMAHLAGPSHYRAATIPRNNPQITI